MKNFKRKRVTKKPYKSHKKAKVTKKFIKKKFVNKPKKSLNGYATKTGTNHWLTVGKAVYNTKRQGWLHKLDQILPELHYMFNTVGQIAPTSGLQAAAIVSTLFDVINTTVLVPNQEKGHLITGTSTTLFSNQGNAPCFLTLYDYMYRRDLHVDDVNYYNPLQAWTNDPIITSGEATFVTATPFDSPAVTGYYNILRVTRINLAAGETCEHITRSKPNRIWDAAVNKVGNTNPDTQFTGGWRNMTTGCLAVVSGGPGDALNGTTGIVAAKIDYVNTVRYHYSKVTSSTSSTAFTNTIGTAANEITNVGSGVAAVYVGA